MGSAEAEEEEMIVGMGFEWEETTFTTEEGAEEEDVVVKRLTNEAEAERPVPDSPAERGDGAAEDDDEAAAEDDEIAEWSMFRCSLIDVTRVPELPSLPSESRCGTAMNYPDKFSK
jgi:hypothetical protein